MALIYFRSERDSDFAWVLAYEFFWVFACQWIMVYAFLTCPPSRGLDYPGRDREGYLCETTPGLP